MTAATLLDMSNAVELQVAGHDAVEMRIANRRVWPRGPRFDDNQIMFRFRTTGANQTVTLMLQAWPGTNTVIDWGDGSEPHPVWEANVVSPSVAQMRHTHVFEGHPDGMWHDVIVTGDIRNMGHHNQTIAEMAPLSQVPHWGGGPGPLNAANAFANCFRSDDPNINGAYHVTSPPSTVTSAASMFANATHFNGDMSSWDTQYITQMGGMFSGATAFTGRGLSNWDMSNVETAPNMFANCTSLSEDITGWDLSSATNIGGMFAHSGYTGDLSSWTIAGTVSNMFQGSGAAAPNPTGLHSWDVSRVTNMSSMFNGAQAFNQPLVGWDTSNVTNMSNMFNGAWGFNQVLSLWDVSNVTNMTGMFNAARAFTGLGITDWDVSNVTNMSNMFNGTHAFNQSLSNWNPTSLTNATSMFQNAAAFNSDIIGWHLPSLTNANSMFQAATVFDGDLTGWVLGEASAVNMFQNCPQFTGRGLSTWDTSRVTNMQSMFQNCPQFNAPIGGWDVGSVTNMQSMFNNCPQFNQPLGSWRTGNVTTMQGMFSGATAFNQDLRATEDGAWDMSRCTTISRMFNNATSFDGDLTGWVLAPFPATTNMAAGANQSCRNAFSGATSFTGRGVPTWDVSNTRHMMHLFALAPAFNQDLHEWNVVNLQGGQGMFQDATSFDGRVDGWQVAFVHQGTQSTGPSNMFQRADSFTGRGIETWDTANSVNFAGLFNQATAFNADLRASGRIWDVSGATQTGFNQMFQNATVFDGDLTGWVLGEASALNMFLNCPQFTGRGLSTWDTSRVTSMQGMFHNCPQFNAPIGGWDVGSVTNMQSMFNNCPQFNTDISAWDASSCTTMASMFSGCVSFDQDLTGFTTSACTTMASMFNGCVSFDGSVLDWDTSNVTTMANMFNGAQAFRGIGIASWDVSSVTHMGGMFANAVNFSGNIAGWDVSSVTNMGGTNNSTPMGMFENANAFNTDIGDWDVSAVNPQNVGAFNTWSGSMVRMFRGLAMTFNQDLSRWNVQRIPSGGNALFQFTQTRNAGLGGVDWPVERQPQWGQPQSSALPSFNNDNDSEDHSNE